MKLLLDTHVRLWWLEDPPLIADAARVEIANPRNAVYVSAASIQEIVIKQGQKRLSCPEPLLPLLDENNFSHLPVTLAHALARARPAAAAQRPVRPAIAGAVPLRRHDARHQGPHVDQVRRAVCAGMTENVARMPAAQGARSFR